jgi:hypothetical protein
MTLPTGVSSFPSSRQQSSDFCFRSCGKAGSCRNALFLPLDARVSPTLQAGEMDEDTLAARALAEEEATNVLIAVRDSGPGLNPKGLNRLFDAFYTTKPQGLGMGLAISRSIIEAPGGCLWAMANVPEALSFSSRYRLVRRGCHQTMEAGSLPELGSDC